MFIYLKVFLCILYSGCSVVGLDKSSLYRYVEVGKDSLSFKALLHTLFHILGRYHEHERADRKEYVDIIEENIIEGIYIFILATRNIYVYVNSYLEKNMVMLNG